jgi:hypothetical protein
MIGWLILAGYLLGWVLSLRPAMRRWMLHEVCVSCRLGRSCPFDSGYKHGRRAARGAIEDRNGLDAAGAVWIAAWWPFRLVAVAFWVLLRTIGGGLGRAVMAGRLTEPELERRMREQQAEIARLTAQIGES